MATYHTSHKPFKLDMQDMGKVRTNSQSTLFDGLLQMDTPEVADLQNLHLSALCGH